MSEWDNPNNDNDSWYSELNLNEDQSESNDSTIEDIKPVKIGKGGVVVICIIFFSLIFIFSILSVGWFSGGKSNKKVDEGIPVEISGEGSTESYENSPTSESSTSISASSNSSAEENHSNLEKVHKNVSADSSNYEDTVKNDVIKPVENEISNSVEKSGFDLTPVREPVFSESGEAVAKIISKDIFKNGISYIYSVKIAFVSVSENSVYSDVRYFCPRKTYDALSLGDEVSVEYDLAEDGTMSIVSMSK